MREKICPECKGARLKKEALSITIDGLSIAEVTALPIDRAIKWVEDLEKDNIINAKEKEMR